MSPARLRTVVLALAAAGLGLLASPAAATPPAAPRGAAPALAVTAAAAMAAVDPALLGPGPATARVVVRLRPGAATSAEQQVQRLGGEVTRSLPIIGGFAATLPRAAVRPLAATGGVEVVSADTPLHVQTSGGTAGTVAATTAPKVVQAPAAWSAGATGQGVTVALLDTGVAAAPDLAGRVVPVQDDRTGATSSCYDLSGEGSCADGYGHGTFMAGLIAASAPTAGGTAVGAAPGARVLSIKVAGADGSADVSTVIAGLQWVVSFHERYGVRVLNLSLGTDSTQSWKDDPLNYAVERAWDAGVLVVVAASNNGPGPGTIAKPGDDPWVVTVGADDDRGTPGTGDDELPDFSSRGPTADGVAKPDVVAPGAHVLSLRAPGSTLDRTYPPADPTSPYRAGSGTSMATAVVSGVAAVALSAHPALTPDQLKHALTAAARPAASPDPSAVGAGLVDAYATALHPAPGAANAGLGHSTGRGDLALSRGSLLMQTNDPAGTVLSGRQTAQLLLWDPLGYTTGDWTPATWYTSADAVAGWNTTHWYAGSFDGHNWTGHNWTGHNWTGSSWYGERDDAAGYGRHGAGAGSYGGWD